MSIISSLITDRTQSDVDRANELEIKIKNGNATESEAFEWATELKGRYNAGDLNRVGEAILYLKNKFERYGYSVNINVRTDWAKSDKPKYSDIKSYLDSVSEIRNCLQAFSSTPLPPKTMDTLSYEEANHIEKILIDVENLIKNMNLSWFYSSEIYSGEA